MSLEKPRFLERCPGFQSPKMESTRNIRIIRVGQQEFLTKKQIVDYYEFRKQLHTVLFICRIDDTNAPQPNTCSILTSQSFHAAHRCQSPKYCQKMATRDHAMVSNRVEEKSSYAKLIAPVASDDVAVR